MIYKIVEKKNQYAVHGIFDSMERAKNHLENIIPVSVKRGYFMDKSLKVEDFEIVLIIKKQTLLGG